MKTVNTKIKDNNKEKMIAARKLFNENIMLILNFIKIKKIMIKKSAKQLF